MITASAAGVRNHPEPENDDLRRGPASRAAPGEAGYAVTDRRSPRLRAFLLLFVAVPLAGVLIAGLVSPWIVGPGLAARSSADLLRPLPSALGDSVLAGNSVVLAADGSVITYFYRNNRIPVQSDRIAPVMKQALVDIEDVRFYEHHGIDLEGTVRALVSNL